jgi:hypothetical protein
MPHRSISLKPAFVSTRSTSYVVLQRSLRRGAAEDAFRNLYLTPSNQGVKNLDFTSAILYSLTEARETGQFAKFKSKEL